ncbi:helix-turn-helix domain-containing protein [Tsukamurella paurometabola]|uniref:DNA binding domain, excisionase family n=1 Tax=Tsukamurella paurometabola TaxID=2061 RepID=A0A3P8MAV0_TSUPA|nr:helix-turn-helix domain-containing protein [Tsukamurella paurometabola]UEA81614.1 helix-turn-helix domain-containing protein [Tsukamurella paurometabola]VDR38620.1 DNA binding domain, excisionase family [Tsukamurella paurometabola]
MTNQQMNPEIAQAIATLLAAAQAPAPQPDQTQRKALYTVPEAQALLRMSKAWVYREIQQGRLPAVQLGRRRMIPAAAIDALLAGAPTGTEAADAVVMRDRYLRDAA